MYNFSWIQWKSKSCTYAPRRLTQSTLFDQLSLPSSINIVYPPPHHLFHSDKNSHHLHVSSFILIVWVLKCISVFLPWHKISQLTAADTVHMSQGNCSHRLQWQNVKGNYMYHSLSRKDSTSASDWKTHKGHYMYQWLSRKGMNTDWTGFLVLYVSRI